MVRALAAHQCGLGSIPEVDAICWFSSLLRGFFSEFSGFRPSTKTDSSKFYFDNLERTDNFERDPELFGAP